MSLEPKKNNLKGTLIGMLICALVSAIGFGIVGQINKVQDGEGLLGATICFPYQGCTGTGSVPANGQILVGSSTGQYYLPATSSLSFINNQLGFTSASGTSVTTTNLNINGLSHLGTIAYAGAVNSYISDVNLPIQIIGAAVQYGVSRTAATYGLLFGAYNATTYAMRVVSAPDTLAFIVNNTTQALSILPTGRVGIATTTPQALFVVGSQGGSIVDANTPFQMSTGPVGSETNIGINKNGAYGFLLGFKNNITEYTNIGTFGLMRMVTNDPFAIMMNSTNISTLWNSSGDVGLGGNVTASSTMAGSIVNIKASGNVGFGATTTPMAQISSLTKAGSVAIAIASSTGALQMYMGQTGNVSIGVSTGKPLNDAKFVVRGDGLDIGAFENSSGGRVWTIAESGSVTYGGTLRINGGQIINGSASDAIMYTLTAGTSWMSIANVSTSVGFAIAGPNGGGQNTDLFQIRTSWTGPKVGDIWAIDKNGNTGIGTSTPRGRLAVDSIGGATTTVWFNSTSTVKGACLVMKDAGGTGLTFCTTNAGTLSCSTVDCR